MKKINDRNINTEVYWSGCYADESKRAVYEAQGTHDNTQAFPNGIAISRKTMRFKTALTYVKHSDKVLDLGCGVGVFTSLVAKTFPDCEVWGVDISKVVIEANRKKDSRVQYHSGRIGALQGIPQNYFDLVFSGETLEHLDSPDTLFVDAYKSLKSCGKFVLTTPDGNNIQSDEHVWEFTHEDIESLYLENGFKDVQFVDLPNLEHLMVIFAVGVKK